MAEATSDREHPASESKKQPQKTQGWIRMHSDEKPKLPPVDELVAEASESRDRRPRKEQEKS
jgi:hypothetical protein